MFERIKSILARRSPRDTAAPAFDDASLEAFQDIVFDATGVALDPLLLRRVFARLPAVLQEQARRDGLTDARVAAEIVRWLQGRFASFPEFARFWHPAGPSASRSV